MHSIMRAWFPLHSCCLPFFVLLDAPLTLLLSIHMCPTVDCIVSLVVHSATFPGMGLLGCCGPDVGPWCLHLLCDPVWQLGREGTAYCKSCWEGLCDGNIAENRVTKRRDG